MYNQSLIKDLRFDTIAKAKTRDSRGKIAYVAEKDAMYFGVTVTDGTTNNIADDDLYLATPVTDVFWKKYVTSGGGIKSYAAGDSLTAGDFFKYQGALFITSADIDGGTDATFESIAAKTTTSFLMRWDQSEIPAFLASNTYVEGERVIEQSHVWVRNATSRSANAGFSYQHFDMEEDGETRFHGVIPSTGKFLKVGDLFLDQGILFQARISTIHKGLSTNEHGIRDRVIPQTFNAFTVGNFKYIEGDVVTFNGVTYDVIAPFSLNFIADPDRDFQYWLDDGGKLAARQDPGRLPASGDADAPADGVPSSINPAINFSEVQGLSAAEAIMKLHFPATVSTQLAPTLTRVTPANLTIDKGDAITSVQLLFTQNQGGGVNGDYTLGVNLETPIAQAGDLFDVSSSVACQSVIAPVNFICTVPYEAGTVPNDSYGNPSPDDQIQAGIANLNFTITPVVHTFHGLQLKGEDLTTKTSAELRTLADSLTQATGTIGTFSNVTIPNTSDYYVLIPGTMSTVTTVSQGFTITGIGTIEGQVEIDDKFGTATSTYTIVKLAGQAAESVIDTVTIS